MKGTVISMKIVKILLAGLVLIVTVYLAEILVTLPFGMPANAGEAEISRLIFWEFLLTAIPAGLLSLAAARLFQPATRRDALRLAGIWTALYIGVLLIFALANGNLAQQLGTLSLYILLACFFLGPLLYARLRRLH